MIAKAKCPDFLWKLFRDLRSRKFPLGIDDFEDLRTALQLGFGWSSHQELIELCCTLWAKSSRDVEIIRALSEQYKSEEWVLTEVNAQLESEDSMRHESQTEEPKDSTASDNSNFEPEDINVEKTTGLPPITLAGIELPPSHLVFVPSFPVTYREVAQAWRRIRQPARFGPATEIDFDATIAKAIRAGVLAGPVLIPPRRNTSRILLLVDSLGSMTPFSPFTQEIIQAITSSGNFARIGVFYFHDTPSEGSIAPNELVPDGVFPTLDTLLGDISPLSRGYLFGNEELTQSWRISDIYENFAVDANVVIISDGGAARGNYDYQRLLDTVASIVYLRKFTRRIVWLNPLPKEKWKGSTAAQVARHIPMFEIEVTNLEKAVAALKANRFELEKEL